jgi:riboflavin synthase
VAKTNVVFLHSLFTVFYIYLNSKNKHMFSGIVEEAATVVAIEKDKTNLHLTLKCSFTDDLKIDQSIAHNGVCLTVVRKDGENYTVTAIQETLDKSNLGMLKVGDKVNLERSMVMNGRLDGHIVQGHVDQIAECVEVLEADGSWYFTFRYDVNTEMARQGYMTVEKGSICVNGVSLTVVNSRNDRFSVAIIPYTYDFTNFHQIKSGTTVNLEFDILGKYISKLMELKG